MTDILSVASTLFMHTGSRHLSFDLTDAQKKLINHPFGKVIILFAMFYMSTRSIFWSTLLVAVYFLVVNMLLNESHPLNVFSVDWLQKEGFSSMKDTARPSDIYLQNLQQLP